MTRPDNSEINFFEYEDENGFIVVVSDSSPVVPPYTSMNDHLQGPQKWKLHGILFLMFL